MREDETTCMFVVSSQLGLHSMAPIPTTLLMWDGVQEQM